ncbi:MAG: hypothetical protein JEZ09_07780 [Salinivirgaceae bacterium]|nr:hypothetical protein [Salinivirgaceae bacterium]
MRFKLYFVASLLIICLINNNSLAQDTAIYEVKTNLFSLGKMQAIYKYDEASNTKTYQLKSTFNLWSLYNVVYLLKSEFVNNVLVSTFAKITANDKIKRYCVIEKTNNHYVRTTKEKIDTLKANSIKTGITCLYFEKFKGSDSIFAELSGNFIAFKKVNEREFILGDKDIQQFMFNNERVQKITVPNAILDFYIVLQ